MFGSRETRYSIKSPETTDFPSSKNFRFCVQITNSKPRKFQFKLSLPSHLILPLLHQLHNTPRGVPSLSFTELWKMRQNKFPAFEVAATLVSPKFEPVRGQVHLEAVPVLHLFGELVGAFRETVSQSGEFVSLWDHTFGQGENGVDIFVARLGRRSKAVVWPGGFGVVVLRFRHCSVGLLVCGVVGGVG